MAQPDGIALAAALGEEVGGPFSQLVFEEMQIAFVLKAARHPRFTSGFTGGRLRENLLIVAPPGWGKSYSADMFLKHCMGAVPYSDSHNHPRSPRYTQLDGSSVTAESVRGGCTQEGRPIRPLVLCTDFFFSTDLVTTLGTGDNRTKFLNMILLLAEDGKMDVNLLKMEELDDEAANAFADACATIQGMAYIAKPRRGFHLESAVPFICCTTDMELRGGKKSLETIAPGVISRFTVIEWVPSDHEVASIWAMDSSDVDFTPLLRLNETIWRTPISSIPFPPSHLIGGLKEWFLAEVRDAADENGSTLGKNLDRRFVMRMARLMAASAISRAFEGRQPGDTSPIKELAYDDADVEFARRKMQRVVATIADRVASDEEMQVREKQAPAMRSYLEYLRKGGDPWPVHASRNGFKEFCVYEKKMAETSVGNYLSYLKKAGVIQIGHGRDIIRNDEAFLRKNRFRQVEEEAPRDDEETDGAQYEEGQDA